MRWVSIYWLFHIQCGIINLWISNDFLQIFKAPEKHTKRTRINRMNFHHYRNCSFPSRSSSLFICECAFDALYTTFSTRNHFECFDKFSIFLRSLALNWRDFRESEQTKRIPWSAADFYSRISFDVTVHGCSTKALDILLYIVCSHAVCVD